jgi:hypothetical protein
VGELTHNAASDSFCCPFDHLVRRGAIQPHDDVGFRVRVIRPIVEHGVFEIERVFFVDVREHPVEGGNLVMTAVIDSVPRIDKRRAMLEVLRFVEKGVRTKPECVRFRSFR